MSPEERDELIQFILQSQSDAAERHRKFEEDHRKSMERMKRLEKQSAETHVEIQLLASATHDLVEVARMHGRRLDRLEGLTG